MTVYGALAQLACAFDAGTTRAEQELAAACRQLVDAREADRLVDVDAHVLLYGFEILAGRPSDQPRKQIKLRYLRDQLKLLLSTTEVPVLEPAAPVALWAEVIAIAGWSAVRSTGRARAAWAATAQAWAEGLRQIIFANGLQRHTAR